MTEAARATRPPIRSYEEDIEAYQRAMKLVPRVYALVKDFPPYEQRDLAAQMRRASKSEPANIAEGYAKRSSTKEFKHYLRTAMASANEIEVHLKIASELGYIGTQDVEQYVGEYAIVGKQLNRLISGWRQFQPPASSIQLPGG